MQTKWMTLKEKVAESMRIPPIKKMEWLNAMNEFDRRCLTEDAKRIRLLLKQKRNDCVRR
jgi:hypothetical protein